MVAAAYAAAASSSGASKAPKVSAPKFVTPVGLPAFDPKAYDSSLTRTESNIYNVTVNGALDSQNQQLAKL
jgi:hypothetical protein